MAEDHVCTVEEAAELDFTRWPEDPDVSALLSGES